MQTCARIRNRRNGRDISRKAVPLVAQFLPALPRLSGVLRSLQVAVTSRAEFVAGLFHATQSSAFRDCSARTERTVSPGLLEIIGASPAHRTCGGNILSEQPQRRTARRGRDAQGVAQQIALTLTSGGERLGLSAFFCSSDRTVSEKNACPVPSSVSLTVTKASRRTMPRSILYISCLPRDRPKLTEPYHNDQRRQRSRIECEVSPVIASHWQHPARSQ